MNNKFRSALETRLLDLREFVTKAQGQDSATLVTLEHDGAPGALIATGFALNRQTGFSSNLTFADCGTAKSMTLAGAHIRIGLPDPSEGFPSATVFRAPLLVANTMDKPVSTRISIEYTIGGQPASIRLSPINLASREVKEVDLGNELERRGITGVLDDAGIDISYDGMPGTVIGRLTSYDASGEHSFDVPIKDPEGGPSNGSYPWRLDSGYSTVLHLKNTLDKEATAIYKLIYEDGEYNPKPVKLAPHQTIAIDIRNLRDAQEEDLRRVVMPRNLETGKIVWMALDPQFVIIGRNEVAKVTTGIASSFSCNVCECGSVYVRSDPPGYLPYLAPSSLTVPVGATGSFQVNEYMKDVCSNDPWGPFGPSGSVSWSSSNTAIATVSGQTITAVGAGSATITGTWSGDLVAYGYMCSPQYGGGGASATLQVLGPKKLVRFDYTAYSPGAPNGYGPLILTADTNNEVRNVKNEVKQTNQCGVYRNLVYELTDVNGTAITPAYSITEKFSNYQHSSSYTSGTTPSDFTTSISANGLVQDTMYLGKTLPSCLGPDDNESFDQSFVVTLNGTQYTLTTVNHVSRGRFAGVYKVDVTITTQ